MIEETTAFSPAAKRALAAPDFWQKLEQKYRIEVSENKATVWERRRIRNDRRVLVANAILGTKALEISVFHDMSPVPLVFDVYAEQLLTELNVASQLRDFCLFIAADWELAQKTVSAGE